MKKWSIVALLALVCCNAQATEKMYGVATAGYADSDFSESGESGLGYSLALGHQFADKWYVEAGYQRLIDETSELSELDGQGLYLAILGKAGGPTGELYYKLGVMKADIAGFESPQEGSCGTGSLVAERCQFDEGVAAGLVGLGFDYQIGLNSMMRIEGLYVRGEHDLSVSMVNIGFRYNFN